MSVHPDSLKKNIIITLVLLALYAASCSPVPDTPTDRAEKPQVSFENLSLAFHSPDGKVKMTASSASGTSLNPSKFRNIELEIESGIKEPVRIKAGSARIADAGSWLIEDGGTVLHQFGRYMLKIECPSIILDPDRKIFICHEPRGVYYEMTK